MGSACLRGSGCLRGWGGCGGALDGREAEGRLRGDSLHLGSGGGFQNRRGRGRKCSGSEEAGRMWELHLPACSAAGRRDVGRPEVKLWEALSPPAALCPPDRRRGRTSWERTEPSACRRRGLLTPPSTHTHGHVPACSKAQLPAPQRGSRVHTQHADPCPPACRPLRVCTLRHAHSPHPPPHCRGTFRPPQPWSEECGPNVQTRDLHPQVTILSGEPGAAPEGAVRTHPPCSGDTLLLTSPVPGQMLPDLDSSVWAAPCPSA